jgi:hypothetical protein
MQRTTDKIAVNSGESIQAAADEIRKHDPKGLLGLGAMSEKQRKKTAGTTEEALGLRQLWSWYLRKGDEDSIGFRCIRDHQCHFVVSDWMNFKAEGKEVLDHVKPGEWTPPLTEAEKAIAANQEWAHLDDPVQGLGECEFPVDAVAEDVIPRGTMLWEMMRFIQANEIRPQPLFRVSGALAWGSNIFGRKVKTACGLRTNLYLLNIGRTACGKDTAVGCLDNSRLHFESKHGPDDSRVDNGSQGDAGLARSLEKCPALLSIVDESGIEMAEMLSGEGQSHKNRLVACYLKLSTIRDKVFRLPKYANAERDIEIAAPCWTFMGMTTEATIGKALTGGNVASGFLPRCLVFWSKSFPDKVDPVEVEPSYNLVQLSRAWRAWFPNGQTHDQWRELPNLVRFEFSPEAKTVLKRAQAGWGKIEASDSPLAPMFTRAEETAKKVALILAANLVRPEELDQGQPEPIRPHLVGAACALVDWSIRSACKLIEAHAEDTTQGALVRAVLDAFTSLTTKAQAHQEKPEPGVPAWKVRKNFRKVDDRLFDGAIRHLRETKQLVDVTPLDRKGELLCPISLVGQIPRN